MPPPPAATLEQLKQAPCACQPQEGTYDWCQRCQALHDQLDHRQRLRGRITALYVLVVAGCIGVGLGAVPGYWRWLYLFVASHVGALMLWRARTAWGLDL